jgi:hypothetical protein
LRLPGAVLQGEQSSHLPAKQLTVRYGSDTGRDSGPGRHRAGCSFGYRTTTPLAAVGIAASDCRLITSTSSEANLIR